MLYTVDSEMSSSLHWVAWRITFPLPTSISSLHLSPTSWRYGLWWGFRFQVQCNMTLVKSLYEDWGVTGMHGSQCWICKAAVNGGLLHCACLCATMVSCLVLYPGLSLLSHTLTQYCQHWPTQYYLYPPGTDGTQDSLHMISLGWDISYMSAITP